VLFIHVSQVNFAYWSVFWELEEVDDLKLGAVVDTRELEDVVDDWELEKDVDDVTE
jgi:hypothetical protein